MFKVGDKVICVDASFSNDVLTLNKKYTIIDSYISYSGIIYVINDRGYKELFYFERFILDIKVIRKEKLNKICSK